MRAVCLIFTSVAVLFSLASAQAFEEPIPLKVLYAGDPKSPRTADFRSFLENQFTKVGLADYLSLNVANTQGYDVVILDWPDLPPRDETGFKRPALGRDYDRPTVLIGGGTLAVSRHLELKVDDFCLCLGDAAHGLRTDHEIFHKPQEVAVAFEDRPTPTYYRDWPEGQQLGQTIKVWKVQKRGWAIDRPGDLSVLPGMVSDPYGFADSPDAEVISSGINMKSPESVAIGRHGNFLLWGFCAAPSDLTSEARKCFVNAICYIRKFDGQRPIVHKMRGRLARQWAVVYARAYKTIADRKAFAESQPEAVRQDPEKFAALHRERIQKYWGQFPENVRKRLGNDPDLFIEFYQKSLEFLRPAVEGSGFPFEVDEEVKELGLSNRKVELLDRCVSMLERNDRPELALRILKRYTTEDFSEAGPWRSWLEEHRRLVFFTDSGGYKFMLAPETGAMRENVDTPNAQHPAVAQAKLSSESLRPGEAVDLVVTVKVAPTWHIYAMGDARGPGFPTTLKLTLPHGIKAEGDWVCPEPLLSKDGQKTYEGTLEFRRHLRVARDVSEGPIDASCEFGYQACDLFSCRLPTKTELKAKAVICERRNGKL